MTSTHLFGIVTIYIKYIIACSTNKIKLNGVAVFNIFGHTVSFIKNIVEFYTF